MLTAGFNHRGQTLLHFGTIGLEPKSKRTWFLLAPSAGAAVDIRPGKTEADPVIDLGRNSDSTERGSMRWRGFPQPRCDLRDRLRRIASWQLSILDGWTAPLMAPVARDDSGR